MELSRQYEVKQIDLNVIRIDAGTQSRERIDMDVVREYADALRAGAKFPPLVVFNDGAEQWLADGFHRWHAHQQGGVASAAAEIHAGSLDDAMLYAAGANRTHGLRRSNEDKRRSVQMALAARACREWSDTQIANHCGVSVSFVGAIRRPEVAQRQADNRTAHESKKAAERSPTTARESKKAAERSPTTAPAPREASAALNSHLAEVTGLTHAERLAEALDTIASMSVELDALRDRLAVGVMEGSEEEKLQAACTIKELRVQVRELDTVKASRDTYMRENAELKKQVAYWRKQAQKAVESQ